MSDKEKKDILFQIDMQLYDEFNDKFCEMNDNLGTIYTYKDIDDLEKLEKETEIELLRKAIEKQQNEITKLTNDFVSKIKAKIEEYDDKGMTVNLANRSAGKTFQQAVYYEIKKVLQSLIEKE